MTHHNKKSSKFGLGLMLGSIVGGLTAFFLSPKSGEENREMVARKIEELKKAFEEQNLDEKVQEIFGEVTTELKELYTNVKDEIINRLTQLKESVDNIDMEQYKEIVEDTVKKIKKGAVKEEKKLMKLKEKLMEKWVN